MEGASSDANYHNTPFWIILKANSHILNISWKAKLTTMTLPQQDLEFIYKRCSETN
jgi:hypothetical protein